MMLRGLSRGMPMMRQSPARLMSTVAPTGAASTQAISNPTLRKLETRWDNMTEAERDDIISQLAERQKADWKTLTPLEKKATWFISYGEWGPRRPVHPKGSVQKIIGGTILGVLAAAGLFLGIRSFMPPPPKTMSKEWQEKANEILAEVNAEPFSGHNQVQSPATGISEADLEDDDE